MADVGGGSGLWEQQRQHYNQQVRSDLSTREVCTRVRRVTICGRLLPAALKHLVTIHRAVFPNPPSLSLLSFSCYSMPAGPAAAKPRPSTGAQGFSQSREAPAHHAVSRGNCNGAS